PLRLPRIFLCLVLVAVACSGSAACRKTQGGLGVMGLLAGPGPGATGLRMLAATLFLAALATSARADTYKLDPEHTEVRFSWDHLGMSRQSGRFIDVEGTVEFDPASPEASRVDVVMKVA